MTEVASLISSLALLPPHSAPPHVLIFTIGQTTPGILPASRGHLPFSYLSKTVDPFLLLTRSFILEKVLMEDHL